MFLNVKLLNVLGCNVAFGSRSNWTYFCNLYQFLADIVVAAFYSPNKQVQKYLIPLLLLSTETNKI